MTALLKKLFPYASIRETVMRFPMSAACSAGLFVMIILMTHDIIDDSSETTGKICFLLGAGYFWFGIRKLIAESTGMSIVRHGCMALAGFAGVGMLLLSEQWVMHVIFLSPALLLLIMVAPYTRGGDDISFWFFNRMTWFGVAVAMLASLIWGGGLSAALASIDYLFNVEIKEEVYVDLWAFSCVIFGPLYALSWVPVKFHFTEEECNDPPGLAFLLNWVLAPLIVIYMLILYAYLVKILIAGEMPRGQLAYMITGFGGVGVATYLMAWPLRLEGGPLLRFVHRWFFAALIIPVIMQALSAYMRIQQYGITEERYAIALTALWFAIIAILFAHKQFPLKFIPAILAGLLILASFGPWGAASVSGYSQFQRLESLLVKNNILQDGHIVKAEGTLAFEDRKSISSILDYMQRTKRTEKLRPWFEGPGGTWIYPINTTEVTKQMGFEYVSSWSNEMQEGSFNFYTPQRSENVADIHGFDYLIGDIQVYIYDDKEWSQEWPAQDGRPAIKLRTENGIMHVEAAGAGDLTLDLAGYVAAEYKRDPKTQERSLSMEASNEKLRARLVFRSVSGGVKDGIPRITNANFQLLIAIKR